MKTYKTSKRVVVAAPWRHPGLQEYQTAPRMTIDGCGGAVMLTSTTTAEVVQKGKPNIPVNDGQVIVRVYNDEGEKQKGRPLAVMGQAMFVRLYKHVPPKDRPKMAVAKVSKGKT